jgi:DUF4097 and DUF4098 domain-containing protein YvlB
VNTTGNFGEDVRERTTGFERATLTLAKVSWPATATRQKLNSAWSTRTSFVPLDTVRHLCVPPRFVPGVVELDITYASRAEGPLSQCDNGRVALPPSDARVRLRVSTTSGRVDVIAEDSAGVVVERGIHVSGTDDRVVEIRPSQASSAVAVRCPTGTDVMVGTASGAVELRGQLGSVSVTSVSGRIRVAAATEADLRTTSGKIEIDECTGHCRASTKSGAVRVGVANALDIATVSGTVRIGRVAGTVDLRTVSGTVVLFANGGGPIGARTLSGSITIRLPPGVRPHVAASDARWVHCRCEQGDDVTIEVASMSGRVEISPA